MSYQEWERILVTELIGIGLHALLESVLDACESLQIMFYACLLSKEFLIMADCCQRLALRVLTFWFENQHRYVIPHYVKKHINYRNSESSLLPSQGQN